MANTRRKVSIRGPTNKWDEEQRTVLHVLHEHFSVDTAARTKAFNALFQNHLAARGLASGLTWNVLQVQYCERNHKPKIWASICAPPSTEDERKARRDLVERVREAIASTRIGARPIARGREDALDGSETIEAGPSVPDRVANESRKRLSHFALTPPPSKRQRTRVAASTVVGSAPAFRPLADRAVTPAVTRSNPDASPISTRNTTSRVATAVVVDNERDLTRPPMATPKRARKQQIPRTPVERSPHQRPYGPIIRLSQDEIERANQPCPPVPEALAHPPLVGSLFYRYYNSDKSFGHNSPQGFKAARFLKNNARSPAPKSTQIMIEDVENHVSANETHSPFVAVANNLLWLARKALTQTMAGREDGMIALIDADYLSKATAVYHLYPWQQQMIQRSFLLDGKWRYGGMHEYLVWREIPREAMISAFSVDDLHQACHKYPLIQRILRPEVLTAPGNLKTTVVKKLKSDYVPLDKQMVVAIAKLCQVVGLSGFSELGVLEHFVMDIIQGFQFDIQPKTRAEWAEHAELFVHDLCGKAAVPTLERALALEMSFLYGVRNGLGDFNALHLGAQSIKKLRMRALSVGLDNPTKIILESMANATRTVLSLEREHNARDEEAVAATARLPPVQQEHFQLRSNVDSPMGGAAGGRRQR